jgi:hypothetical protein
MFANGAQVRGAMPRGGAGARSQRERWEGGRLRMLAEHVPGLIADFFRGRMSALEPLLDLLLLPLSYHVVLLVALSLLPVGWALIAGLVGLSIVALHIVVAARVGGLSARHLLALIFVPFYLVWKVLLIPATIATAKRHSPWVRTAREAAEEGVKR